MSLFAVAPELAPEQPAPERRSRLPEGWTRRRIAAVLAVLWLAS